MSAPWERVICSPECPWRAQRALVAALWHYTTAPISGHFWVRGCIPDLDGAAVTVALWAGPAAREKRNLFFSVPFVSGELPVAATQVVTGLMRLSRGTHIFGTTGRRFDGKPVLNGSRLVEGRPAACLCAKAGEPEGPRAFYFERPGQLKQFH
ncbi:hypothetical protein [Streptomyces sp. NPDC058773]|uniref:hypothetical protein n=1 Tax=Streptomyces sp. NPDC058773 TaxID=3346632 RepID=UPI003675E0F0